MENRKITFDDMPAVLAELVGEVKSLSRRVADLNSKDTIVNGRKVLSTDEVCEILNRKRNTIYKMVAKGELPCVRQGRLLSFYEDEIIAWLESGRQYTVDEMIAESHEFID